MKKTVLLFVLSFVLFGCTISEPPIYKRVESIKVIKKSPTSFIIQANVLFTNPNDVGGTLQIKDVKIYADRRYVTTIDSEPFKVPKKDEFIVPVETEISYAEIFADRDQDLLNVIMNVISSKQLIINFDGILQYKKNSYHFDYHLDYTKSIRISK